MFFIFLEWKCDKIILKTTLKNKHTTLRQGQTYLIINNIQDIYFFSKKNVARMIIFCTFAVEIWQSGRSRRSWKPLYRNVSGVRIPLSPLGSNSQMGCFLFEDRLGEMPEWSNGAVSKTVERYAFQGFESLSLRIFWFYGVNILSRFRGGFFFFAAPAYRKLVLIFIWSL